MPSAHPMNKAFSYRDACTLNIDWVAVAEQHALRHKQAPIVGMGGLHLLTIARLGIGAFHFVGLDIFAIENFNRQVHLAVLTIKWPKVEVLAAPARGIDPDIDASRLLDSLTVVHPYFDDYDFFAVSAGRATFLVGAKLGIPALTAAPLAMGACSSSPAHPGRGFA